MPPPLDYEKPDDPEPRWMRLTLYVIAALTTATLLVPVACITAGVVRTRSESRKFHEALPENQILGQSVAAVRARYGQPDSVKRDPDGTAFLIYASPSTWEYCGIEFKDDKATKVSFWSK